MKIREAVVAAIEDHARRAAPNECCGLLLGADDEITMAVAAANSAADPTRRYTINPADHFHAIRMARAMHLEVLGAYHSHPHSAPIPSDTDRSEAFENFLFVIAGFRAAGRADVRAWRLIAGNFAEVSLVRLP